ncbi:MAG TPA: 8-amino-7-oxononanoate synthase [Gammaproteobacteria bacterium]|nr:8-amino-7-oxononanoate synthase [Gammaproteobacteria bacterium]
MTKPADRLLPQLQQALSAQRDAGLHRQRRCRTGTAREPLLADKKLANFSSNDYLGLSADTRVAAVMIDALREYGAGAGAAELVSGHTAAHAALERELAEFCGTERALLFSTGYMANLGVITALAGLAGRGAVVMQDRLNHASLIDGAVLARARLIRYRHADPDDLHRRLQALPRPAALVATDGVFSMDGDIAPLPAISTVCRHGEVPLVIDDAHGLGVLGDTGRGSLEHHHLHHSDVAAYVGTFGKALGLFGAFVAGSEALIETLIQRARTYAYTTALPPALVCGVRESLRIVREEPRHRERLHDNIRHFCEQVTKHRLPFTVTPTPIQPLIIGNARRVTVLSEELLKRGYWVPAIRPPTVPEDTARLRVSLTAAHTPAEIDAFLRVLAESLEHP